MTVSAPPHIVNVLQESLGKEITNVKIRRTGRIYVTVNRGSHRRAIVLLLNEGYGISTISGVDGGDSFELNYHLRQGPCVLTIKMSIPKEKPQTETITDIMPSATLYEREVHDLFGINFEGHANLKRLELPDDWPAREYPLRKSWSKSEQPIICQSKPLEIESSNGRITLVYGPQHPALHEPEMFLFELDGEYVVDVEPRIGYCHRGIEKYAEKKTYLQDVYLTERICGICNVAHSLCFCQTVEEIGDFKVPTRAQYLRSILAELNRIHSHMLFLGTAGYELGFESLFMYVWRDREIVLDIIEAMTGNRIMSAFNTIGGTRRDLSTETANKIIKGLNKLTDRMKYYREVFCKDPTLTVRTENVGVLTASDALRLGAVGPVARGSGIDFDVRKEDPYAAYGDLPVNTVIRKEGDVLARLKIRVEEVFESINIIDYAITNLPTGPFRIRVPRRIGEGEAVSRVEAPRGEDIHYVKSNGTTSPERVKVRAPTLANIPSVCHMFKGCYIADIPAVLVSIDPCFACTDRMTFIDTSSGKKWGISSNEVKRRELR